MDIVPPDGKEKVVTNGIYAEEEVLSGIRDAQEKIAKENPDRIITIGGNCMVSLASFDYLAAECMKRGGMEEFHHVKNTLISEFNALRIEGLEVSDLNLLNGFFVNLEYPLANGQSVKLLEDYHTYLGNQDKNKVMKGNERWEELRAESHANIQSRKGNINRQTRLNQVCNRTKYKQILSLPSWRVEKV